MVGTSRCDVPVRVPAGGTAGQACPPGKFVPSPDAALGDGDGAARPSLPHRGQIPDAPSGARVVERSLSRTMISVKRCFESVTPLGWLLITTLVCLIPFVNKAFHIDDTLFLRAARQIQEHPLDFYGFDMNWFGVAKAFPLDFDNPPLTCYYIALVASIAGWSEPVMHVAFLLPALAAAWGIFRLARLYSQRPLTAGILVILSPGFLISATNVMCDVMLLAFWVWSIAFFEQGLEKKALRLLVASGVLAGLAVLTKFTGLALIPLLAAYGFTRQPRLGLWLVSVTIPVLFAIAYEWITHRIYGIGLLFAATAYSSHSRDLLGAHLVEQAVVGLAFAGGSFLPILFCAPLLWSRRGLLTGLCVLAPLAFLLPSLPHLQPVFLQAGRLNWFKLFQGFLFTAGGVHILVLVANDFWQRRDSVSFLLVTWLLGIFVFAIALNWTVNGRSFLPAAPALGILVARRLDLRPAGAPRSSPVPAVLWPALASAVVSLYVAGADYRFARLSRLAADRICEQYQKPGSTVWFEGHWGFQYYMEKNGAKAIDITSTKVPAGDILVLPSHATNVERPPADQFDVIDDIQWFSSLGCTTTDTASGAGFYASVIGPLPFVAGQITPGHFWIFRAK